MSTFCQHPRRWACVYAAHLFCGSWCATKQVARQRLGIACFLATCFSTTRLQHLFLLAYMTCLLATCFSTPHLQLLFVLAQAACMTCMLIAIFLVAHLQLNKHLLLLAWISLIAYSTNNTYTDNTSSHSCNVSCILVTYAPIICTLCIHKKYTIYMRSTQDPSSLRS